MPYKPGILGLQAGEDVKQTVVLVGFPVVAELDILPGLKAKDSQSGA